MIDIKDPEKENHSSPSTSTMAHSTIEVEAEKEISLHEQSSRSSLSTETRHSEDSVSSDPLGPLERALTVDLETPEEHASRPFRTRTALTTTSIGTTGSRMPDFEIDFEPDDPDNPRNWPLWYRSLVILAVSFGTLVIVFYSTSYTAGMPGMMLEFDVTSEPIVTLGVTTYLFGLACGSLILAPMSEIFGRRPVYFGALFIFMILVLPCALANSLEMVIIFRFFGAMAGSCMIANAPGTVSDISDEAHRALAFSIWSIGPMNGPVLGPLVGGFVYQFKGWRWTNWLVMMLGGVSWIFTSLMKETYAPAILKKKAAARRKETGDERWWCRYDEKLSIVALLKVNLSRPFVLTFTEPILWFWDLYISVIYGILYLCFVAYPIIFTETRGWSPGVSGLAFCGIGGGTMIAIISEPLIRRMINSHAVDPDTGKVPPEASVSIVCIAAIAAPIGQLIFAWTSLPISIHWIWSILAGIPFGFGNAIVFIYASNYIAGSYGIYAASALAGNSVIRSFFGGTLPLAGPSMYEKLSPQWAGTLLGILEAILIPIPFVFYKWGKNIRAKSPLIRQMREDAERNEKKNKKRNDRRAADLLAQDVERVAALEADQNTKTESVPVIEKI